MILSLSIRLLDGETEVRSLKKAINIDHNDSSLGELTGEKFGKLDSILEHMAAFLRERGLHHVWALITTVASGLVTRGHVGNTVFVNVPEPYRNLVLRTRYGDLFLDIEEANAKGLLSPAPK